MNISSIITKINNPFKKVQTKKQPTTEELINRGFAPKNNKIDILFINPPSSIAERYGKEDMGDVGGDLIPLGMASLAAYVREQGYGVGVLDCPTLRIDNEKGLTTGSYHCNGEHILLIFTIKTITTLRALL